jgi:transcriptional regulator with XRE-family HTH domain
MATKTGDVLKQIIEERRLTVKEISKGAGIPASTLAEWLNNRTPRDPEKVRQLAKFLGITTHFLLFGVEDAEEPLQKILKEDLFSGIFEINIKRVKTK